MKIQHHLGQTLVELMVALPLMVVIIGASSGLIIVMSKSKSLSEGAFADQVEAIEHCQRILADVRFAKSLAESSEYAVEFSTSDRDGNGIDESVRYSWSGVSGDPLTYQYNNSLPENLVDNVHDLNLTYQKVYDFSESLINYHDDSAAGTFATWSINSSQSASQYILPEIPDSASHWTLNRIRFQARSIGVSDGLVRVSIFRPDDTNKPGEKLFESATISEVDLDAQFTWVDAYFANVRNLGTLEGVCVVIDSSSPGTDSACEICYEYGGSSMTANTSWMTSTDGQSSWSDPDDSADMRYFAIGTYDGIRKSRTAVKCLGVTLQIGSNTNIKACSTANLLNEPEVEPEIVIVSADADVPAQTTSLDTQNDDTGGTDEDVDSTPSLESTQTIQGAQGAL